MSNTFMIIDDDINIIQMLKSIISNNRLGKVVTSLTSGQFAIEEILFYNPNIVLIDFLMPEKDGVEVIEEVFKKGYSGKFIMISQVEDSHMISKAYNSGVLFFIKKPINSIEVLNIIKNISHNINLEKSMYLIKNALGDMNQVESIDKTSASLVDIELILSDIGIISDLGAQDLISIIKLVLHNRKTHTNSQYKLQDYYEEIANKVLIENSKNISISAIEQRIRRTIQKALSYIAEIGVDDYYNEKFTEYSTLLFDFKQVKQEMHYIRNNSEHRGKINVRKFIEGVISKL